eukprot:1159974-Pelagomonas_calceolata.AAC.9
MLHSFLELLTQTLLVRCVLLGLHIKGREIKTNLFPPVAGGVGFLCALALVGVTGQACIALGFERWISVHSSPYI